MSILRPKISLIDDTYADNDNVRYFFDSLFAQT
jgi:hypothetical protein